MSALRAAQLRMAAHLRDPARHPAPAGVEERRLQVYRDLIYNNIENFIRSGFPVLCSLYAPADWQQLVRSFMDKHHCSSPLFPEISQEFLRYLMEEHQARDCDPPFMLELAHYEWVELALDIAAEELPPACAVPDPLSAILQLSPLAWVLAYQYPVHKVGSAYRPRAPEPAWLAVYRDRDEEVHFMELTVATARLLERLRDNSEPTCRVLEALALELEMPQDTVRDYALETVQQMLGAGVLVARDAG